MNNQQNGNGFKKLAVGLALLLVITTLVTTMNPMGKPLLAAADQTTTTQGGTDTTAAGGTSGDQTAAPGDTATGAPPATGSSGGGDSSTGTDQTTGGSGSGAAGSDATPPGGSSTDATPSDTTGAGGSSETPPAVTHTVTFVLPSDCGFTFAGGALTSTIQVADGASLTADQIPSFATLSSDFQGWKVTQNALASLLTPGPVLSEKDMTTAPVTGDVSYTAVFNTQPKKITGLAEDWATTSAASIIATAGATNIVLIDPSGTARAYPGTTAGLQQAATDLNTYGNGGTWLLYIGANVTDNGTGATAAPALLTQATTKIDTLVITGNATDPVNTTTATAAPASSNLLTMNTTMNFDSNLILRNLRYSFGGAGGTSATGVYMNGYDLTLSGGSWYTTATTFVGGANGGTLTVPSAPGGGPGTATMTVYSTGTGGGTFIGGMYTGTMTGNAAITINGTSGDTISVFGAGYGSSAANNAILTGNATTTITGMSTTGGGLNQFAGGGNFCNVGGQITNTVSGPGRFSSTGAGQTWGAGTWLGGSVNGNIGSAATAAKVDPQTLLMKQTSQILPADYAKPLVDDNDYVIKNNVDFSGFTNGGIFFIGVNDNSGIVTGNIISVAKAGDYTSGGYISGFEGGGGYNAMIGGAWATTANFGITANANGLTVTTPDAGFAAAKAAASFQLYGNITNVLRSGCMSTSAGAGYYRGGGYGYVEGNVFGNLGTEGLVYQTTFNKYTYYPGASTPAQFMQGYYTGFDMVGGGGLEANNNSYCQIGDCNITTTNVLARWTYGGNFGGAQKGNCYRIMWGGVVDTCEGSGYINFVHVGDSRAELHSGQVDWFLTGGGWGDQYQLGNASVQVYDTPSLIQPAGSANPGATVPGPGAICNATMGGNWGYDVNRYISGDSTIVVNGGNFSGKANTPPNGGGNSGPAAGFCAGPTNNGYIFGNGSVTMDLRGNKYGFLIGPGNMISAGRVWTTAAPGTSYLGTNADNTLTLNIYTDNTGSDLLNGLNLYGDVASSGTGSISNTRAGHIIMDINAPGSKLGNVYATQYNNVSGGQLLRDVTINLVSAASISGLSAGTGGVTGSGVLNSTADNITNAVAQASAAAGNNAVIHVGPQSADTSNVLGDWENYPTADGYPPTIGVTGSGITNFTSMDITKRLLIASDTGSVRNGNGATVANHGGGGGTNYDQFGDVTINDQAGLGVKGTGNFIAGTLKVNGKGYIASQGSPNQIVITDTTLDPNNTADSLVWLKYGAVAAQTMAPPTSWFGINSGYPVLTFNPNGQNANEITPTNLTGIQADGQQAGMTYIGDNQVPASGNGFGVAVPGTFYNWDVTSSPFLGAISYHMDGSFQKGTTKPPSGYLDVYGTSPMDTLTTSGSVAIPTAKIANPPTLASPVGPPVFTFTPNVFPDGSGSWLDNLDVWRSDAPATMAGATQYYHQDTQTLASYQLDPSKIQTWDSGTDATGKATPDNAQYGFTINAAYTNNVQLQATSAIITQTQAQTLFGNGVSTADATQNVLTTTKAMGRPFFTNNITGTMLTNLGTPLAAGEHYRAVPVTYNAGTAAAGSGTMTKTVSIVIVPDGTIIDPSETTALIADDVTIPIVTAHGVTAQAAVSGNPADNTAVDIDYHTGGTVLQVADDGTLTVSSPTLTDWQDKVTAVQTSKVGDNVSLAYSATGKNTDGTPYPMNKDVTLTVSGGKISGTLFVDTNGNGKLDTTEAGRFADKTVYLYLEGGTTPYMTTTSNADGFYSFDISGSTYIEAGDYYVLFPDLSSYGMTTADGTRQTPVTITLDKTENAEKTVDGGYAWPTPESVGQLNNSFSKQIYDPGKDSDTNPYNGVSAFTGTPPAAGAPAPDKTTDASQGYVDSRNVNDSTEDLIYRLSFKVPADTTGYGTLTVKDTMDPGLFFDPNKTGSFQIYKDGTALTVDPNELTVTGNGTSTGQTLSYNITNIAGMAGSVVDVYVTANIIKVNGAYPTKAVNTGQLVLNAPSSGGSQLDPNTDPIPGNEPTKADTNGPNVDNVGVISGVAFTTTAAAKDTEYNSGTDTLFSGVTVTLLDSSGNPMKDPSDASKDWSVTTGSDGKYEFNGLAAGTYGLQFSLPKGYVYTTLLAQTGKAGGITIALGDAKMQQKTQDSGYYLGGPPDIEFSQAPLVINQTSASHIMTTDELKADMTVEDVPDGNLLSQTSATPAGGVSIDTSNVGVYKVNYSVTDSDDNTVNASRAVVVTDGRYIIDKTNDIIIGARNFVIAQSLVTGQADQVMSSSFAEAYDIGGTPYTVTLKNTPSDTPGYGSKPDLGNYNFTWQVAGNTVTKTITGQVINADVVYPGDKSSQYALSANNFKKNLTDAAAMLTGNVDQNFIAAAQATVYPLNSTAPTATVRVIQRGNPMFTAAIGVYPQIQFGISVGGTNLAAPPNWVEVTGTVSQGESPVILADPSPLEVWVGDPNEKPSKAIDASAYYDKYGVSASDYEDNGIGGAPLLDVNSVTVDDNGVPVNTAKVGIYHLTYNVTDSDGNPASLDRVVVVNDGSYIVGAQRIMYAASFVTRLTDVPNDSSPYVLWNAQVISKSAACLYDATTGANLGISDITVSDLGGYKNTVGEYTITLQAPDGNTGDKVVKNNITGKVVAADVLRPTDPNTNGGSTTYVYGNNLVLTISEAQALTTPAQLLAAEKAAATLAAPDGKLSDVDVKVVNANGFGYASATVGTYTIDVSDVNDQTPIKLTVQVTAGNPPTLDAQPMPLNILIASTTGDLTNTQIMTGVVATDIEDGAGVPNNDITNKVTYTIKDSAGTTVTTIPANVAGIYTVTYSVTDNDGNNQTVSRALIVNDGSYVYDTKYILRAQSFIIAKSKADPVNADTQILSYSNAKAWQTDGTPATAYVPNTSGYPGAPTVQPFTPVLGISGYATLTRQITAKVVDDISNPVNGDRYSITANDFRINLTDAAALQAQKGTAAYDSAFLTRSAATAYDRADTGLAEAKNVTKEMTDDGGFATGALTEGATFTVTFAVAEDPSATTKITVLVSDGQKPVIKVPFTKIWIGTGTKPADEILPADYKPMTGVSANDSEDGDLTGKVQYGTGAGTAADPFVQKANPIDTSKASPPVQQVTYTVTDSDYNQVYATANVLVDDGTWAFDKDYAVHAQDFVTTVKNAKGTDTEILNLSGAQAYNIGILDANGNPTMTQLPDSARVVIDNAKYPGGSPAVVGDYTPIQIGVDPAQDPANTGQNPPLYDGNPIKNINGKVIDKDVINGPTGPTPPTPGDNTRYVVAANNVDVDYTTAVTQDHSGLTATAKGWLIDEFGAVAYKILDTTTPDAPATGAYGVDVISNDIPATVDPGGVYHVVFSPANEPSITVTVTYNVSNGTPPDIEFQQAPLVINQTSASHIMTTDELKADMTVEAVPDGNLLAQTVVTDANTGTAPSIDTSIVGVYKVTYTVQGQIGGPVSKSRAVVVQDGRYIIDKTNDIIIGARNFVIAQSLVTGQADQVQSASYAEAYDISGNPYTVTLKNTPSDTKGYGSKPDLGDYDFTWQVAGNTVTKTITGTVVNADQIYPGDKSSSYALTANNFKKNLLDAGAMSSDADFITAANATVYPLVTGAPTATVRIIDRGGFTAKLGTYPIEFGITAGSTNLAAPPNWVTINGVVSQGDSPWILADPSPLEVWIGTGTSDNTNAITAAQYTGTAMPDMYGVTAGDTEDNGLNGAPLLDASDVTVNNNGVPVDTTKVGIYHLTYSVTDSDNNPTTVERVVVVNDGSYIVGAQRIMYATSFVVKLADVSSDSSQWNAQVISKSAARLYDAFTGADLGISDITVNDLGGYKNAAGEYYPIKLQAPDGNTGGNVVKSNITGKVVDADVLGPTTTNTNGGSVTYVYGNNLILTISEAQALTTPAQLLAAEKAAATLATPDGKLSDVAVKVVNANGFGYASATVGTYTIDVSDVNDQTPIKLTVQVSQGNPPTLDAQPMPLNILIASTTGDLTNTQIMTGVVATDIEDGAGVPNNDITNKVTYTIKDSAGTTVTSIPGDTAGVYQVTYSVTDNDGNNQTVSRALIVNDGSYVYDTKYILRAQSFIIAKSKADPLKASDQILSYSNAKAWMTDGSSASATVTNTGGYPGAPTVDTYSAVQLGISGYANLTRTITAKVIDDTSNPVNGNRYSITANDFRINLTDAKALAAQVGTPAYAAAFLSRSAATAYDRATVDLKPAAGVTINMTDDGKFSAGPLTEGATFKVTVEVAEDPTATTTFTVLVSDGQKPVITVPDLVMIWAPKTGTPAASLPMPAGYVTPATYDAMTGVTAKDSEDGVLTSKVLYGTGGSAAFVESKTPVDFSKYSPPFQQVTYTVTDSDYNQVYATANVLVNDGTLIVKENYVIQAQDFVTTVKTATGTDSEILKLSDAKAWNIKKLDTNGMPTQVDPILTVVDKAKYPGGTPAVVGDYTPIQIGVTPETGYTGDPIANINGKVIDKDVIAGPTDPTPGDGDNTRYVVAANNVTLKLADAPNYVGTGAVTKQLLIQAAAAEGYIITDTTADYTVDVLSNGIVNPTAGNSYDVTFIPTGQPTITATVTFTIDKGVDPKIEFQEAPLVVKATPGASHILTPAEMKASMTATDMNTNTSLLSAVTVTPAIPIDTQNVGVTKVTYNVTDSLGNTATATRAIVVDDGRYVITDSTGSGQNDIILGAKNFVISSTAPSGDWGEVKAMALSYAEAYQADGTPISASDISWTGQPAGYQAGAAPGNYTITWQVAGYTGVTKAIKAIVTNADVIDQGGKDSQYAIVASNFQVNMADAATIVKNTPQSFISEAQAAVVKLVDSAADAQAALVSSGAFSAAQGVYGPNWISGAGSKDPIRFVIADMNGATLIPATTQKADVTGVVSQGEMPVLTAQTPVNVWIGLAADMPTGAITAAQYKDTYGVTASDYEDNGLNGAPLLDENSVVFTANGPAVDLTTVGIYKQNLSVTDSDNNTVTAQRVVVVNDGTYIVSNRILTAKSFVAKLSDVTSNSSMINTEILSRSATMLYDGTTGIPIQETFVQNTGDNGSGVGYSKAEGTYKGIVVGGINNPATATPLMKTITGKVVDASVIVVTPDPQVEGKDAYYAYGNNIQLTPVEAQAIIDDPNPAQALLTALGAGADKAASNGTLTDLTVAINDDGGFLTQNGTTAGFYVGGAAVASSMGAYSIIIQDAGGNVKATLTAQVSIGPLPVITCDNPKVVPIDLNNSGNLTAAKLLENATAYDQVDKDLTGAIVLGQMVNGVFTPGTPAIAANKASVTQITYQVTNSAGSTVTKSTAVIVDDGSFVYDDKYVLRAQSFVIGLSKVDTGNAKSQIIMESSAQAWTTAGDPATVDISSFGGYDAQKGYWKPTLIVVGDPAVYRQITARVFDDSTGPGGGNGGNGDAYSIIAQNFRINLTDAAALAGGSQAVEAASFLTRSGAESYLRADQSLQKSGTPALADDGGFLGTASFKEGDTFTARFWVNEDHTAYVDVQVLVSNANPPILTVIPPTEQVDIGDTYAEPQYMTGVTATDAEDGNLIAKVTHDSPVNTSKQAVFVVNYSVTDSDYNTVKNTRVVAVGPWIFKDGYAVLANDFSKRVGEITGTSAEALTLSGATAFCVDSSKPSFGQYVPVTVSNLGGYKKAPGQYTITFAVQEDPTVTFTATANISTGGLPDLSVPAYKQIAIGQNFGQSIAMQGVTAVDPEDGNITNKITYDDSNANTAQTGSFMVPYTITDSDGNKVTKQSLVLVGSWIVQGGYAISAQDFQRKLSQISGTSAEALSLSKAMGVNVNPASTGYGQRVAVSITNLNGYRKAAGDYNITFAVSVHPSTVVTIKASIIDDTPQIITNTVTNNNNTTTTNTITRIVPAPAPAPTPEVVQPTPTPTPTPIAPTPVPQAPTPVQQTYWSLINLIMTILAAGVFVLMIAAAAGRRARKDEEDRKFTTLDVVALVIAILAFAVALPLLLITNDFGGAMQVANTSTPMFIIFGVAAVVSVLLSALSGNKKTEEEEPAE